MTELPLPEGVWIPAELSPAADRRFGRKYLLALPHGYHADAARPWPLVLFLHGRGEWGDDLALVRSQGIGALVDAGRMPEAIVVAPQTPEGQYWHPLFVDAVLREVEAGFRVEASRRYLTGLSMGGFGTLNAAITYPHRFAAIAPICGGLPNDFIAAESGAAFSDPRTLQTAVSRIAHLPIFIAHGEDDPVVPVEMSRRVVRMLESCGNTPEQRWLDGVGHDAWTPIYFDESAFFPWLLRHRLVPTSRAAEPLHVDPMIVGTYVGAGASVSVAVSDGSVSLRWENGRRDLLMPLDGEWFVGTGLARFRGHALEIPGLGELRRV
jgi:predicted esterase